MEYYEEQGPAETKNRPYKFDALDLNNPTFTHCISQCFTSFDRRFHYQKRVTNW